MSTALAPAPLVSAFRRAKDVYFSGGEITILQITLLRVYFKRIVDTQPKAAAGLRRDLDGIKDRKDVARWLEKARAAGVRVFQNGTHAQR